MHFDDIHKTNANCGSNVTQLPHNSAALTVSLRNTVIWHETQCKYSLTDAY